MTNLKPSFQFASFLLILMVICQCSKSTEKAPFFDGLYLEYKALDTMQRYEFTSVDENEFKLVKDTDYGGGKPDHDEYVVDKYGIVKKADNDGKEGYYSSAWIPVGKLKVGDTFGDGFSIVRTEKWKNWDVLVVKPPFGDVEIYYDNLYGFKLGQAGMSATRKVEFVLTKTNFKPLAGTNL
jgi:hypothetical protein